MKNSDDASSKKYSKRNHIKDKSNKIYHDDDILQKRAHKQFKQKKRSLEEDNDDWKNWKDYI